MADDPLSDLMRSPLEDDSPRRTRGERKDPGEQASWWPLPVAVAIGGLIALGGFVLTDGDDGPASSASPTTVAITVPTESSDFPTGYHQLNELVAARPERLLVRDDTVFVSFSTAVRAGLDPAGTSSFSGGLWRLSLDDGRSIDSFGEFLDPFAPGVFTLAFPINGYGVDDITEVQLTGEVVRAGASHVMQLTFDSGLPWTGTPDGNRIPLQGGLDFVIGEIRLRGDGGELDWHLEGDEEPGAVVAATLNFFNPGNNFSAGTFRAAVNTDFFSFFGAAIPPPTVERSGTSILEGSLGRPSTVERGQLTWNIDWNSYIPAEASIPIDEVRLVTIAG